jgi:hypothetical protein
VMVLMYFSERVSEPTPVRQVLLSVSLIESTCERFASRKQVKGNGSRT